MLQWRPVGEKNRISINIIKLFSEDRRTLPEPVKDLQVKNIVQLPEAEL